MIQTDKIWSQIVHYYIDKKGYSKEDANNIAQRIITREINRKICQNVSCNHLMDEHINKKENCLVTSCTCKKFLLGSYTQQRKCTVECFSIGVYKTYSRIF